MNSVRYNQTVFTVAALRFGVVAGTDASGAHLDSLDSAAFIDFNILKIDFKSTLHVFDDVHPDTAGFLGKTLTGDATAVAAGFAAECADLAHC